jgi:hypothetical protein
MTPKLRALALDFIQAGRELLDALEEDLDKPPDPPSAEHYQCFGITMDAFVDASFPTRVVNILTMRFASKDDIGRLLATKAKTIGYRQNLGAMGFCDCIRRLGDLVKPGDIAASNFWLEAGTAWRRAAGMRYPFIRAADTLRTDLTPQPSDSVNGILPRGGA